MADIRLQNRDGSYSNFLGIDEITLPKVGGGTVTFSRGGGNAIRSHVGLVRGATASVSFSVNNPSTSASVNNMVSHADFLVPVGYSAEPHFILGIVGHAYDSKNSKMALQGTTLFDDWDSLMNYSSDILIKTETQTEDGRTRIRYTFDATKLNNPWTGDYPTWFGLAEYQAGSMGTYVVLSVLLRQTAEDVSVTKGTITYTNVSTDSGKVYIKLNTPPASASDYDYEIDGDFQTDTIPASFDAVNLYVWSNYLGSNSISMTSPASEVFGSTHTSFRNAFYVHLSDNDTLSFTLPHKQGVYGVTKGTVAWYETDVAAPHSLRIKKDTAPSSDSDYDYELSAGVGAETVVDTLPASFSATKLYIWSAESDGEQIMTSPVSANIGADYGGYANAYELTLNNNITLSFTCYYEQEEEPE